MNRYKFSIIILNTYNDFHFRIMLNFYVFNLNFYENKEDTKKEECRDKLKKTDMYIL